MTILAVKGDNYKKIVAGLVTAIMFPLRLTFL